jgi:hypothetical protein
MYDFHEWVNIVGDDSDEPRCAQAGAFEGTSAAASCVEASRRFVGATIAARAWLPRLAGEPGASQDNTVAVAGSGATLNGRPPRRDTRHGRGFAALPD